MDDEIDNEVMALTERSKELIKEIAEKIKQEFDISELDYVYYGISVTATSMIEKLYIEVEDALDPEDVN